jgi:hypothetical protein
VFKQPVLAVESVAALRKAASARPKREDGGADVRAFPANDTPLRIPEELERLRGETPSPERA